MMHPFIHDRWQHLHNTHPSIRTHQNSGSHSTGIQSENLHWNRYSSDIEHSSVVGIHEGQSLPHSIPLLFRSQSMISLFILLNSLVLLVARKGILTYRLFLLYQLYFFIIFSIMANIYLSFTRQFLQLVMYQIFFSPKTQTYFFVFNIASTTFTSLCAKFSLLGIIRCFRNKCQYSQKNFQYSCAKIIQNYKRFEYYLIRDIWGRKKQRKLPTIQIQTISRKKIMILMKDLRGGTQRNRQRNLHRQENHRCRILQSEEAGKRSNQRQKSRVQKSTKKRKRKKIKRKTIYQVKNTQPQKKKMELEHSTQASTLKIPSHRWQKDFAWTMDYYKRTKQQS